MRPWNETFEHLRGLWHLYWNAREMTSSTFGDTFGASACVGPETADSLRIKAHIQAVTQAITAREARIAVVLRESAAREDQLRKAALLGVERALTTKVTAQ